MTNIPKQNEKANNRLRKSNYDGYNKWSFNML